MTKKREGKKPRRKFVVEHQVQLTIALYTATSTAIGILIGRFLDDDVLRYFIAYFRGEPSASAELVLPVFYLVACLAFAGVMGGAFAITNRMFGPIYSIRRHLIRASEGRTTSFIQLRETDAFHDLAKACNLVLQQTYQTQEERRKSIFS